MKIVKRLKHATFTYDEKNKNFIIETNSDEENGTNIIQLNKAYAFAFMRFVVRVAQRNWMRDKKSIDKVDDVMIELESDQEIDQKQLTMFEE
jgi:hypothetical protein